MVVILKIIGAFIMVTLGWHFLKFFHREKNDPSKSHLFTVGFWIFVHLVSIGLIVGGLVLGFQIKMN